MPVMYEHTFQPDEARALFERSGAYNFRKFKPLVGVQYTRAMADGVWSWDEAEPIRTTPGRAICTDGAHRLYGCFTSGVPLRCVIWEVENPEPQLHLNTGARRTLGDFVRHAGIKMAVPKVAAVRLHLARVQSVRHRRSLSYSGLVYVHDEDIQEFVAKHDEVLSEAVSEASAGRRRGLNQNAYACFLLELAWIDPRVKDEFHADLLSLDLDPEDPLTVMRAFSSAQYQRSGRVMSRQWTIDNLVKAYNSRVVGTRLKIWKSARFDGVTFPDGFHPSRP